MVNLFESWKSRRQDNVSLSTSEAEFVAASQAGQEAIYLRETLTDFGFYQTKATLLYKDNLAQACVAMSEIRCAENSHVILTFVSTLCVNSEWLLQTRAFAHAQNGG